MSDMIEKEKLFLDFLNRLRSNLRLSVTNFSKVCNIDESKFRSTLKGNRNLSISEFMRICETFNISMASIIDKQVDFETISRNYLNPKKEFPKKYTSGAFSKKRTVAIILDYLKKRLSDFYYLDVLNYFQVYENVFEDVEGNISITYFEELFNYLRKYHKFSEQDFKSMGMNTYSYLQQESLSDLLNKSRPPDEIYQYYFEELIPLIEKNNDYHILKLSKDSMIISSGTKKEVKDFYQGREMGSNDNYLYRVGALETLPMFTGLSKAEVRMSESVHSGYSKCKFVINFEKARNEFINLSSKLLYFPKSNPHLQQL